MSSIPFPQASLRYCGKPAIAISQASSGASPGTSFQITMMYVTAAGRAWRPQFHKPPQEPRLELHSTHSEFPKIHHPWPAQEPRHELQFQWQWCHWRRKKSTIVIPQASSGVFTMRFNSNDNDVIAAGWKRQSQYARPLGEPHQELHMLNFKGPLSQACSVACPGI